MWRSEFEPTVKRLEAKLLVAKQQISQEDTPTTALKLSLSILTKFVAKINELKADAEASATKKKKGFDDFEIVSVTELLLDAEEVISELEILLNKDGVSQQPPILTQGNSSNSNYTNPTKLPKLELKKFGGDITMFSEFYETFSIAVDKTELDEIQKFVYLKALLIDDAAKLIAGLNTTKENYCVAKKLLEEKYGNKQHVIQRLYQQLNMVPKATKQTLRQTYDNLESILRSLETMKECVEGGALLSILSKKYPDEILLQVFEETSEEEMTVAVLRKTIKSIVARREKLALFSQPTTVNQGKLLATTEALLTYPKSSHGKFVKTCRYCGKAHYSDSCDEYLTVDQRKEKIKGACFICLREGHTLKKCKMVKPCVYCKKTKNHHRSLCPTRFDNKKENDEKPSNSKGDSTVTCLASEVCLKSSNNLLTATTTVRYGSKVMKICLIFDNGSARSYITESLFHKLNMQSEYDEALQISTFAKQHPTVINTKVSSIELELKNGDYHSISVNTIPFICDKINVKHPDVIKKTARRRKLQLADNESNVDVEILIGLDYYFHLVTEERIIVEDSYLVKSQLGWLVAGNDKTISGNKTLPCFLVKEKVQQLWEFNNVDEKTLPCFFVKDDICKLWELDTIGIKIDKNDNEDDEALSAFYNSITFTEGRYNVAWPWKVFPPDLPSNYQLAYGRLKTLTKRLNASSLKKYDEIIHQQCEAGIVEPIEKASTNICHYLPHHPVETPGKSTDYRVVYDGSAKTRKSNKSLNDCLYKGKVLLEHICSLLLRFRFNKYAILADIEKAFLQIGLEPYDRDTTRFLWLKDINNALSEENLQIFRFTKIPFGVISSPFLLSATIHFHLTNTKSEFATKLLAEFYVDNLVSGVMHLEEGKSLYVEAKKIFSIASMNLRGWKSNSRELNQMFAENNDEISNVKTSVLGIIWNTISDTLAVKISMNQKESCTKRQILQVSSAVFDPLGWFSPIILPAKLLIKKLWQLGVEWDESLSEDHLQTWQQILHEILQISSHEIPRFIGDVIIKNAKNSIHVFVDASQEAYGAVVYLLTEYENSNEINILFAKSRVTPKKGLLTIPRLELLAVLIGVRMLNFVKTSISSRISVNDFYLWSDSRCVLSWIGSNKVLTSFVENRVREIRQSKDIIFRYVPSQLNPADLASRGCTFNQLQSSYWWNGPPFLQLPKNEWPKNYKIIEPNQLDEIISTSSFLNPSTTQPLAKTEISQQNITNNDPLGLEIKYFSTLQQLFEHTVYRMRAGTFTAIFENITSDEITAAENFWIRIIQKESFPDIISPQTPEGKLMKNRFGLWLDPSGVWRCKNRLEFSELPADEKFPILLPTKGKFIDLLILHHHKKLHHAGVSQTLCELRKSYWIIKGRASVYHTIKKGCINCKYFTSYPYKAPPEPPLPDFRVVQKPPFSTTGLDVFGPLYVNSTKNGQLQKKVWCLLFTCLITRAVHLELLSDLTTEEFIMSFRCFIARRTKPDLCISDNAPQFKLTNSIFEKMYTTMLTSEAMTSYLAEAKITWKFIPPNAPWMGGTWERLIGIVKLSLKKTLFKTSITKRQLQTLLTEIEAVVNSRPLLYVGNQFPDEVLTPSMLLGYRENHSPLLPTQHDDESTSAEQRVVALWRKSKNLLLHFWKTWHSHYLQSLQERYKIKCKRSSVQPPKVGDVVLVHDDVLPRIKWTTAKITDLIPSADGEIRSAKIQTDIGNVLIRPIIKLYPLGLELEAIEANGITAVDDQGQMVPTIENNNIDSREEFELAAVEVEEVYED